MRQTNLYQIFDLTAEAVVGPIMLEKALGAAIRSFTSVLSNKNTFPGQYPEQFTLLFIGVQDDETAEITGQPVCVVATGRQWLETQKIGESGVVPLALAVDDADRPSKTRSSNAS